jgi:hypothetical protein
MNRKSGSIIRTLGQLVSLIDTCEIVDLECRDVVQFYLEEHVLPKVTSRTNDERYATSSASSPSSTRTYASTTSGRLNDGWRPNDGGTSTPPWMTQGK